MILYCSTIVCVCACVDVELPEALIFLSLFNSRPPTSFTFCSINFNNVSPSLSPFIIITIILFYRHITDIYIKSHKPLLICFPWKICIYIYMYNYAYLQRWLFIFQSQVVYSHVLWNTYSPHILDVQRRHSSSSSSSSMYSSIHYSNVEGRFIYQKIKKIKKSPVIISPFTKQNQPSWVSFPD